MTWFVTFFLGSHFHFCFQCRLLSCILPACLCVFLPAPGLFKARQSEALVSANSKDGWLLCLLVCRPCTGACRPWVHGSG